MVQFRVIQQDARGRHNNTAGGVLSITAPAAGRIPDGNNRFAPKA
jgi:hypothetical protein